VQFKQDCRKQVSKVHPVADPAKLAAWQAGCPQSMDPGQCFYWTTPSSVAGWMTWMLAANRS